MLLPPHPLLRASWRSLGLGVALVVAPLFAAPAYAEPTQRLLILGDSVSQGTTGDVTWRYRLWQSLQTTPAGRDVDFVGSTSALFNVALNRQDGNHDYADPAFDQDHESTWGTTLATVTPLLPSKLAALPQLPTAIVVALGTNDAPGGTAKALGNMRRLILAARAAAPGVDLVLQAPYVPVDPATGRGINVSYTQSFVSGLALLATQLDTPTERIVVAPTADFDAVSGTWDGHHPSPTGELVLTRTTATALAQIGVGDGPHVPDAPEWPATGPQPTVTFSGPRATVAWPDSTPGALAYALEQRRTTAAGVASDWTLMTQPARAVRGWTSATLTVGDTYAYRLVPIRGTMRGRAGSVVEGVAPVPPLARKPWWQFW